MKKHNPFTTEVLADVADRVARVQLHLQTSTAAWLEIAKEFAIAKKTLETIVYQQFATDAGFTTNVADKLQKIGLQTIFYDPQVTKYLISIDGWTVLYELAKLDPSKIKAVIDILKSSSKKLTRDLVLNVANNRSLTEKTIILASLEVTSSKLASLTQRQSDDVNKKIAEIEQIISEKSSVVAFRKRSKSLKTLAQQAAANTSACLISTKNVA